MAALGRYVPVDVMDNDAVVALAKSRADRFRGGRAGQSARRRRRCAGGSGYPFGPSKAAAQLEASKGFWDLCAEYGISDRALSPLHRCGGGETYAATHRYRW